MKEYFQTLKQKFKQKQTNCPICQNGKKIYAFLQKIYAKTYNKLNVLGSYLANIGVSANVVSIVGFVIGIFAINFVAMGMFGWALIAIILNRFCDALDGAIARASKVTDFGVFLDATLDYIFYAGVIMAFALQNPQANAAAACFLLFAFASAACSMLAYSVVAYKNNHKQELNLDHSPFYLGGAAQGAETLISLLLLCLIPSWFVLVAGVLGVFCLFKAFSMIVAAYYNFVIVPFKKDKNV